jgi:hypothetical protein
MSNDERFSKFFFGILLIGAFFISWGRWIALGLGLLFIISSTYKLCIGCKCKQLLNNTNNKEKIE